MNIDLKRIHGLKGWLAVGVATAGGAGFFPKAPGTMGTLVAVPLAAWSNQWELMPRLVLWTTLTLAGIWSAMVLDRKMSSSDNQSIVIDEVVGLGITAWTAGSNAVSLICAFFLFRAFDIIKPFPVRQLDRWSKKMASTRQGSSYFWGGLGVMADDIVAGFQGLAVMLVLQHFGWI